MINYKEEKYYFRVIDVTKYELNKLIDDLRNICSFQQNKFKNTDNYTIIIELNTKSNYSKLEEFVFQHPEIKERYGIYVSLVTDRDSDGLSVPTYVINLFLKIGGTFDFSFTSV